MDESEQQRYPGGNRLIDGLPAADRERIVAHLTMMVGEEASAGISRGERITAVYFPIDAVFSILVELRGGDCYEADSVGREGLIGAELLLGADIASRSVICQVGGRFAQMPVDAFEQCVAEARPFGAAVHRALLLQSYRAQQTIACNFAHTLEERCARWALLTHDAIGQAQFPLRSEYLAMMLGVQTQVVTEPMESLQAIGAIRYAGGVVTIVSERRLRDAVCECYTAPIEFAQRVVEHRPVQREAQ